MATVCKNIEVEIVSVKGSRRNTGERPERSTRKHGLASKLASSRDVYGPEANIAWLEGAVQRGEVTEALRTAMVMVEESMRDMAKAMMVCQPRGRAGSLSIRWWQLEGAHTLMRTPVLVRLEQVGKGILPKRLRVARRAKPRKDGTFAVNASLTVFLVGWYAELFVQWQRLRGLVKHTMAYRRMEQRTCARGIDVAKISTARAAVVVREARGRAEAAGYDMEWVDRLGQFQERDSGAT